MQDGRDPEPDFSIEASKTAEATICRVEARIEDEARCSASVAFLYACGMPVYVYNLDFKVDRCQSENVHEPDRAQVDGLPSRPQR